ncbi:MAG: cyanophycinase [Planctomycetales bacterium]
MLQLVRLRKVADSNVNHMTGKQSPRRTRLLNLRLSCAGLALLIAVAAPILAAEPLTNPELAPPFDPAGIRGSLVICGGGRLPDEVRDEFVKLAGGKEARLVIIPTASDDDSVVADAAEVAEIWKSRGIETIATLHTRSHDQANDPAFVEPLKEATGVWITGGRQSQIAAAYSGTLVEKELHALLDRRGVVGGTSAGAACQSRIMIVRGKIHETPGLGLIPGAIIDQHFLARDRKARLLDALEQYPALIGLGIDEGTALVLEGRSLRCLGDSTVTVCWGATQRCGCEELTLKPGQPSDLTMLRRAAWQRTLPAFPPVESAVPRVQHGALVIVGGGSLPSEVTERFIALAGGAQSLLVVLPTANPEPLPPEPGDGKFLERAGAKNVRVLKHRTREEVESAEFLETIREARGIWFGGGRQWRFVDAYEGTQAVAAFQDVLRRGGVIGGSSAGATIQGDYLVRGSPLGNEEMMCRGYERGFAFLPGTAIDQHFAQRNRFPDMSKVMAAHPQLLGIGLDEGTAIIVQQSRAEVLGQGKAHFYDGRKPVEAEQPDYESFAAGGVYDLTARKSAGEE